MRTPELIIVTARKLTLPEWQRAIDAEAFLAPLVLDPSQSVDELGDRRAVLGGQACTFGFREVELSDLAGVLTPSAIIHYAFAMAVGEITSCAAGGAGVAGLCGEHVRRSLHGWRRRLLAGAEAAARRHARGGLGTTREFEARYPPPPRGGTGATIGVTRAQ